MRELEHIRSSAPRKDRSVRAILALVLPGMRVRAKCGKLLYVTWRKSFIPTLKLRFGASLYERAYVRWVYWKNGCR